MAFLRTVLSEATYGLIRMTGAGKGALRMLMYHRVTDAHPEERLCVRAGAFAAQMRWLASEGYRTVGFAEAVAIAEGRQPVPERALAITFDDGFEDNFRFAAPALAEHGFKACFFVPSGFIASSGTVAYPTEDRPMTWEQLKALIAQGHEIGAHSVTHRKLTLMPQSEAEREVRDCKAEIERGLGLAVRWFCYPAGAYDAFIREAVARAGYAGACTVRPGANRPGSDVFALKRTEISAFDALPDFRKKLAGAYDWMHGALQTVQGLRKPRECANAMGVEEDKHT